MLMLVAVAGSAATIPARAQDAAGGERVRAREAGVVIGSLPTGPRNAIVDVQGVAVGHATLDDAGGTIHTGVTAILPHGGNPFHERVPAAIHVANGFGKLLGVTQVHELGELETPILLTGTLGVWQAADAMVEWLLARPGMEQVRSINPVVGETNDGFLSDIRARPLRPEHVVQALESASTLDVREGAIGAGAGTVAFGWKGGIGTSSRRLPQSLGGWTVGVLVQSNYGGVLAINGAPVGRELGRFSFQRQVSSADDGALDDSPDGSIMIVVATDAPLDSRNLERLAARALVGLARTGATMSNGSGDYVLAFSTAEAARRREGEAPRTVQDLPNDAMSPLFQAVAEATEEAIYNSLFKATTTQGHHATVEALPLDRVMEVLRKYNALGWDRTLPPGR